MKKHSNTAADPKVGMTLAEVEALISAARAAGLEDGSHATAIVKFGSARVKELTFHSPDTKPAPEEK